MVTNLVAIFVTKANLIVFSLSKFKYYKARHIFFIMEYNFSRVFLLLFM